MRLSLATLAGARVRTPAYDPAALKTGMVHLGVGAFHRAHQGVFTDDAIEAAGGDWGVIGVSMRKPDVAEALTPQDGLYTVETLQDAPEHRVIGSLRRALTLPLEPKPVIEAIADAATHVVTLTVTEKGYCLDGDGLDFAHPDIVHDLARPEAPRSAVGVLVRGLARRGRAPLTVISCDNLGDNGARLGAATAQFAERIDPALAAWIAAAVAFPETMVDCIVPASDAASRARTDAALGLEDHASVQREPFAQWVIQDRFAGPAPAWAKVGVEIVADVAPYRRLKLHVLNAAHSALAYRGLERGHVFVRQAIADSALRRDVEAMILGEVAPALPGLPVRDYWATTAARFANPHVDHRLDQIAQDGAFKLAQRVHPLILANARAGLPHDRLAAAVGAWLRHAGLGLEALPIELQQTPAVRAAHLGARSHG